jgi:hypothetical protein
MCDEKQTMVMSGALALMIVPMAATLGSIRVFCKNHACCVCVCVWLCGHWVDMLCNRQHHP